MIKVGIIGLGCIGSIMTKYLSKNPSIKFYFFSKTAKSTISIHYLNQSQTIPIQLEDSSAFKIELDWVLICLKKYHYPAADVSFSKFITQQTKVAVFRNGLNLKEGLDAFSPPSNILETIIDCSTKRIKENTYEHYSIPIITLPDSGLALSFQKLLKPCEIEVKLATNFKTVQWEKLIESSTAGAIQALTGRKAEVFQNEQIQFFLKQAISESVDVALKNGVRLDKDFKSQLFAKIISYPPTKSNSMLNDLNCGNKLEIEAKIGAINKLANKYNTSSPIIKELYSLVSLLD